MNDTTLPVIAPADTSTAALVLDTQTLNNMMSVANIMATGISTVPKHLQKNAGDCLAVVMQAVQWGMNPFAVAQKTHLVNGVLGYEAQLVNAVAQSSGAIAGRFHYEYKTENNDISCRVGAVLAGDKDLTWGEWLNASSVTTKNSPLWKTNPKQQLGYLQVKNWCRMYCPGAILGVYTSDELEERDVTPSTQSQPTNHAAPQAGGRAQAARERAAAKANAIEGSARVVEQSVMSLDEMVAKVSRTATLTELDSVKDELGKIDMSDADFNEVGMAIKAQRHILTKPTGDLADGQPE